MLSWINEMNRQIREMIKENHMWGVCVRYFLCNTSTYIILFIYFFKYIVSKKYIFWASNKLIKYRFGKVAL